MFFKLSLFQGLANKFPKLSPVNAKIIQYLHYTETIMGIVLKSRLPQNLIRSQSSFAWFKHPQQTKFIASFGPFITPADNLPYTDHRTQIDLRLLRIVTSRSQGRVGQNRCLLNVTIIFYLKSRGAVSTVKKRLTSRFLWRSYMFVQNVKNHRVRFEIMPY